MLDKNFLSRVLRYYVLLILIEKTKNALLLSLNVCMTTRFIATARDQLMQAERCLTKVVTPSTKLSIQALDVIPKSLSEPEISKEKMGSGQTYSKHFIPLESSPEIFTELAHSLGLSVSLEFQDVLSLDDAELIGLLPRPAYGLILVFPTTETYEKKVENEDAKLENFQTTTQSDDVVFFRQTINNACGLYAILHAVCNGQARNKIGGNESDGR